MTEQRRAVVEAIRSQLAGTEPQFALGRAESAQGGERFAFTLSTPGEKRDRISLDLTKMDLSNFKRNPVALWQHGQDLARGALPIGRWHNVRMNRGALVGELEFDMDDPFAANIARKYLRGYLTSVSISWLPRGRDGGELLEVSAVAVPADPDARLGARALWVVGDEARHASSADVISRKGNAALVKAGAARTATGPSAHDRLAEQKERAYARVAIEEIQLWETMTRAGAFRNRHLLQVQRQLTKYQQVDETLHEAFEDGDKSLREIKEAYKVLTDSIFEFARTIPGLKEQVAEFILSDAYTEAVRDYQGEMQ